MLAGLVWNNKEKNSFMSNDIFNNLPSYVKEFHESLVESHGGGEIAEYLALQEVKRRVKVREGRLVANSTDFIEFDSLKPTSTDGERISFSNSENGVVLNAILADTSPRKSDGRFYTERDLCVMADRINREGLVNPADDEHESFEKIAFANNYNAKNTRSVLARTRGFIKNIKANVEDGKLWIQAWLDDKYQDMVDKYHSLSVETLAFKDRSKRMRDPQPLGFIFTNTPELENSKIVKDE